MSNYWDLVCKECKESAGFHWNHGEDVLYELWQKRASLAGMDDAVYFLETWVFGHLRMIPESAPMLSDLSSFAIKHQTCTVLPRSEYGYWLDQCPLSYKCKPCGHSTSCKREVDHGGYCGEKK